MVLRSGRGKTPSRAHRLAPVLNPGDALGDPAVRTPGFPGVGRWRAPRPAAGEAATWTARLGAARERRLRRSRSRSRSLACTLISTVRRTMAKAKRRRSRSFQATDSSPALHLAPVESRVRHPGDCASIGEGGIRVCPRTPSRTIAVSSWGSSRARDRLPRPAIPVPFEDRCGRSRDGVSCGRVPRSALPSRRPSGPRPRRRT
jgi:hypothetical protein